MPKLRQTNRGLYYFLLIILSLFSTAWAAPISILQMNFLQQSTLQLMQNRTLRSDEQQLYARIYNLANNTSLLEAQLTSDPVQSQQRVNAQIDANLAAVDQWATALYGQQIADIVLAKNAYILMSYDALNRYNPNFYWTKLGIFAANEVRSNLSLIYSLRASTLQLPQHTSITIAEQYSPSGLAALLNNTALIFLSGQMDVVSDLGAYVVIHKRFGSQALKQVTQFTPEVRQAFALLETAEQTGRIYGTSSASFRQQATDAAIIFGIHEQTYLLQPMWDKPTLQQFDRFNTWLLNHTAEQLGLRADIFMGVNKFKPSLGPYLIIRTPWGATSLTSITDRIAIARNGFNVQNQWRQNTLYAPWIDRYQSLLGKGEGIYQPILK